jgi:hypothetical protein
MTVKKIRPSSAPKISSVNWTYDGFPITSIEQFPTDVIGIIYRIYNLDTERYYIGRKTIRSIRKRKLNKKEKELPENKRKTFAYEVKEISGWKNYHGSNETLKNEVSKGAKIVKEILHLCSTKAEITYLETKEIFCSGALEDTRSYNDWAKCTVYKKNLTKKL